MINAQRIMKQLANKKRSDKVFDVGDLVYLKLQPYKQKSVPQHKPTAITLMVHMQ